MNVSYTDIGLRIRKLRELKGYSRKQLSVLSDISAKFLYEIETGQKGLSALTLYKLSENLSVSTDYLLLGYVSIDNKNELTRILSLLNSKVLE